jgi:hypothetical protein
MDVEDIDRLLKKLLEQKQTENRRIEEARSKQQTNFNYDQTPQL